MRRLGCLLVAWSCASAAADDVRPVKVQIREQEPGAFLVEWQVPEAVPRQAMPVPELPASCRLDGERSLRFENGNWLNRQRYRCPDGIAGSTIRVAFPLGNPALSTVFRAELLSGERYAHMLAPGEQEWPIPAGVSPDAPLRAARRGVWRGLSHVTTYGSHVALVVAVVLAGRISLVGWFSAAQLASLAVGAVTGARLDPNLAELGVVLAALLLAREALRKEGDRRQLAGLAAAAGALHALGLAGSGLDTEAGGASPVLMVLGMDAAFLVGAASFSALMNRVPMRPFAAYGVGGAAVAMALQLATSGPATLAPSRSAASQLPPLSGDGAGAPTSSRVAARAPEAPMESFVSIEAFEVRHEILIRLDAFAAALELDPDGSIALDDQARVKQAVKKLGLSSSFITIDGAPREPAEPRVDFMTVDAQGALVRETPVREAVADAVIGLTVSHMTPATPQSVTLTWVSFHDAAPRIPSTMIDPEASMAEMLTEASPDMKWENALSEDPVPRVEAVTVEPKRLPLPMLSIPLLFVALGFARKAAGAGRSVSASGWARVMLALAMLVAPVGVWSINLPSASADSPEAARRIIAGILPNVYRAFEFREESQAYDRLSLSVTGDTLTDIYLEHRRALEMEERGGARARVEAVEVGEVSTIEPLADGGFEAETTWRVGGTVTHFGHRHFRQNRYNARVTVVPVEERWKLRAIEVLQEERVR